MTHPTGEQLAAYWLGELDDATAAELEEHVFACDACTSASGRSAQVIAGVRALLPPVISSARLAQLRAAVPALRQAEVAPGGSATVEFGAGDELFVLRLAADLGRVERVDFSIEVPSGPTLVEIPDAPFDAQTGAVHVVCQRHFLAGGYPKVVHMRLRAVEDGQATDLGRYEIEHVISG
jgi:hypothetical protein